jgi:hypothetical protein
MMPVSSIGYVRAHEISKRLSLSKHVPARHASLNAINSRLQSDQLASPVQP